MKVIHQLIEYFTARGFFTAAQVQDLMKRGLWKGEAPENMEQYKRNFGLAFVFTVVGDCRGPVWGTEVYTSDSRLAAAAVHMGLVRPGEARVLKVTMVQPLAVFSGSSRNGVTTSTWKTGWPGAYRVETYESNWDAPP